jgi:hypothetical protein
LCLVLTPETVASKYPRQWADDDLVETEGELYFANGYDKTPGGRMVDGQDT